MFFGIITLLFLAGCYPEGLETYGETDIVVTDYNTEYNFAGIETYFMPDTIHHIGEEDPDRSMDSYVITQLALEFENLGYTRLSEYEPLNPPDVAVTVSVLEIVNVNIYSNPWPGYGWGGDWPYYGYGWGYWGSPGYGSGYPWYGYSYVSSYSTGTIIWNLWDPDNAIDDTEVIPIEWTGAINGLMGSSTTTSQNRILNGIRQAFDQSPYLNGN